MITPVVFDYIDDRGWYDLLLKTARNSTLFVRHLIEVDRMERLLRATLKLKRKEKANDLIKLYYQRWPEKLQLEDSEENTDLVEVSAHHSVILYSFKQLYIGQKGAK